MRDSDFAAGILALMDDQVNFRAIVFEFLQWCRIGRPCLVIRMETDRNRRDFTDDGHLRF